jgi:hypothetical protein
VQPSQHRLRPMQRHQARIRCAPSGCRLGSQCRLGSCCACSGSSCLTAPGYVGAASRCTAGKSYGAPVSRGPKLATSIRGAWSHSAHGAGARGTGGVRREGNSWGHRQPYRFVTIHATTRCAWRPMLPPSLYALVAFTDRTMPNFCRPTSASRTVADVPAAAAGKWQAAGAPSLRLIQRHFWSGSPGTSTRRPNKTPSNKTPSPYVPLHAYNLRRLACIAPRPTSVQLTTEPYEVVFAFGSGFRARASAASFRIRNDPPWTANDHAHPRPPADMRARTQPRGRPRHGGGCADGQLGRGLLRGGLGPRCLLCCALGLVR